MFLSSSVYSAIPGACPVASCGQTGRRKEEGTQGCGPLGALMEQYGVLGVSFQGDDGFVLQGVCTNFPSAWTVVASYEVSASLEQLAGHTYPLLVCCNSYLSRIMRETCIGNLMLFVWAFSLGVCILSISRTQCYDDLQVRAGVAVFFAAQLSPLEIDAQS